MYERTSLVTRYTAPVKRAVRIVPFVELLSGRLQGVVSSGSDMQRVMSLFSKPDRAIIIAAPITIGPVEGSAGRRVSIFNR